MTCFDDSLVKVYDSESESSAVGYIMPSPFNDKYVRVHYGNHFATCIPKKICRNAGLKLNDYLFDWDIVEIKMCSGNIFHYLIQFNEERCAFELLLPYQCNWNGKHFYDDKCNPITFDEFMSVVYDPLRSIDSIRIIGNAFNYEPLRTLMINKK